MQSHPGRTSLYGPPCIEIWEQQKSRKNNPGSPSTWPDCTVSTIEFLSSRGTPTEILLDFLSIVAESGSRDSRLDSSWPEQVGPHGLFFHAPQADDQARMQMQQTSRRRPTRRRTGRGNDCHLTPRSNARS